LEQSLAEYPGRPILNSARVVKEDLDHKIKLMHKYGGMLILLAMDDQIPDTAAARVDLIKTGVNYLNENGIKTARILADPLMLSLGAGQNPEITLKTINQLNAAGIKTILGLSNLSFGMEARSALHAAFIAQAIREGLNAAILDPVDQNVMNNIKGSLLLLGKRVATGQKYQSNNEIVNALLAGDQSETNKIINYLLREYSPLKISQEKLGKAMELIGQLYEKQEIFLPQLLLAARTVEPIFTKLNNLLSKDDAYSSRGKVLLATVKNDIHDIGKNIIQAVLVGSGFQVKDIGKDQSTAQILAAVKSFKPDIVGLSAMMTGTIAQLEETVTQLKSEFPELKIMAGGASLTEELALAFGCDAYAANAISALKKCEILIN